MSINSRCAKIDLDFLSISLCFQTEKESPSEYWPVKNAIMNCMENKGYSIQSDSDLPIAWIHMLPSLLKAYPLKLY